MLVPSYNVLSGFGLRGDLLWQWLGHVSTCPYTVLFIIGASSFSMLFSEYLS
jgi:hypothetical protein